MSLFRNDRAMIPSWRVYQAAQRVPGPGRVERVTQAAKTLGHRFLALPWLRLKKALGCAPDRAAGKPAGARSEREKRAVGGVQ